MPSLSDMPTEPAPVNEVPQTPAESSGRVSSLILRSSIAALPALYRRSSQAVAARWSRNARP